MKLALPAPPAMFPWLAERAQLVVGPTFQAIAAVDDAGRIAGMVGFDGWTDTACAVHVAVEYPAALRSLVRTAFELAFLRMGREVVVAQVVSTNRRSLELCKHLGFREVFRGRGWWKQRVDLHFLEMRREDCRWIRKEAERWAA